MERVRVAVYTRDPLTEAGIASWLRSSPSLQVVDSEEPHSSDVLVVAVDTVTHEVLNAISGTARGERSRLVLVVKTIAKRDLISAARAGVVRLLWRAAVDADSLNEAVMSASEAFDEGTADDLLRTEFDRMHSSITGMAKLSDSSFSSREIDVLRLLAAGWDSAEIGAELSYADRTIKNMIHRILARTGLRNRTHAVAVAIRTGVI